MKRIKNVLFFLLLLPAGLFAQALSDDTLHWSGFKSLTWSDFKGDTVDIPGLAGQSSVVVLARFQKAHLFLPTRAIVETVFDRKNSWVNHKERSGHSLLYEQVLFNLYELYARKLRKDYSESKFGVNPNKIFNERYNNMLTMLSDRNKLFMKETRLGTLVEEVAKWDVQVLLELKELERYSQNK